MKMKFSFKALLLGLAIIIIIAAIYWVVRHNKPTSPDLYQTYTNQELGFKFSYPTYWGLIKEEYLDNPVLGFKGRVFWIEFVQPQSDLPSITPAISEDYWQTPLLQASSPDWEVYESVSLFEKQYNQKTASLKFCQEFIKKTLANSGCQQQIANGHKITQVMYAYYIEEGMMGSGNELYFEKSAFVPLTNEEFPGLEIRMPVHTVEDKTLKTKDQAGLKQLAHLELEKISNNQGTFYTQKKIREFEEFVDSFTFTQN